MGFVDYWRMLMGWWSIGTPPYRVTSSDNAQYTVTGSTSAQYTATGTDSAQYTVTGSIDPT
jgi:hypothetical protein